MNNSYHSTIIEANEQATSQEATDHHRDLAQSYLDKLDLPAKTNFIFLNSEEESFKIEQVRNLKSQAQYGKADEEPMVFIICHAEKITIPAQNALLKLLEEPPANTMLVLVASQDHMLLETIQSRCLIETGGIKPNTNDANTNSKETSLLIDFFRDPTTTNYSDLIDLSEKLKDRDTAIKTLQVTLHTLHKDLPKARSRSVFGTKLLTTALDSLQKNGNVRLVLEDCFFTFKRE